MKSVGIITLCGNDNYGNKLQNYALKKTIEKLGFNVGTIWIDYASNSNIIKKIVKIMINKVNCNNKKNYLIKVKKCKLFSEQYLNNDYSIRISNNLRKIDNKYDYFVVGSDQVWNYRYISDFDLYFMKKIQKNKVFSYSASFGVSDIPIKYYDKYNDGLNHLKNISVRENRGLELVQKISNRKDSIVSIDPTMLLNDYEWNDLLKDVHLITPKKFILTYFLGNLSDDKKNEINKLCKKYDCDLINIMDINDNFYSSSPEEFLYLLKNSLLVCTDSFHACVFSIIFDKTFIYFERDYAGANMNSRIETLLSKFDISDRIYNGKKITEKNIKHDYSKAYNLLKQEQNKSIDYLKKSLDI